jgi:AraC-like DNA-binding protein
VKSIFIPHTPRPELARFVQMLWHADGDPSDLKEKVLPNGVVEWIFNVGAHAHLVLEPDAHSTRSTHRRSWIAGLQESYLVIQPLGDTRLFGIRFRPGGVLPFLHMPLSEVTNGVFEMDLVLGRQADQVQQRLLEADGQGLAAQFRILESFLLSRIDESRWDPLAAYAVGRVMSDSAVPIQAVAEETGITHKHLITRFHRAVGASPKTLQRIASFQRAIRTLAINQSMTMTTLAYDLGYSDQAHFNHDFKSFTGVSPSEYLRARTIDPNHLFVR